MSDSHIHRPTWLAVIALVIVVAAIGTGVWLSSGRSPYATGHRWALYPSTDNDGTSKQDDLAFAGNVRLFSLLYLESTHANGEQIKDVLCHVLIDLPPKTVLRVAGSGGSDVDNFNNYTVAQVLIDGDDKQPLETRVKLRFRFSDRKLGVSVGGTDRDAITDTGNVFVVRISNEGVLDFSKIDEHVSRTMDAKDVERMLKRLAK